MKIVKIGFAIDWMICVLNDYLVCYIEKDVFDSISNDAIMYQFQKMFGPVLFRFM